MDVVVIEVKSAKMVESIFIVFLLTFCLPFEFELGVVIAIGLIMVVLSFLLSFY